jgi:hypothetical protein
MLRAALPALIAVLSLPALARAQPGAPDPGPPPEAGPPPADPAAEPAGEEAMCWRGHCGPDGVRRFAVGVAGGHIDFEEAGEGHQHAILGRVMLVHGFALELELARAELDDDAGTARTGGVALEKFFCTHRRLNPYLAAGAGGGRFERADGTESHMGYGELGGGLMLRGRRFALALDLRAGARRTEQAEVIAEPGLAAAMMSPGDDDDDEWERERYHRARLMLLFQF